MRSAARPFLCCPAVVDPSRCAGVDFDPENCGECGNECGDEEGCFDGECAA